MILFVLSYLGGVLTILSPCILPVLPFVFARADQPFLFHTGMRQLFPLVSGAVSRLIPLESLRWISFGHGSALFVVSAVNVHLVANLTMSWYRVELANAGIAESAAA